MFNNLKLAFKSPFFFFYTPWSPNISCEHVWWITKVGHEIVMTSENTKTPLWCTTRLVRVWFCRHLVFTRLTHLRGFRLLAIGQIFKPVEDVKLDYWSSLSWLSVTAFSLLQSSWYNHVGCLGVKTPIYLLASLCCSFLCVQSDLLYLPVSSIYITYIYYI